jgi:hypothetical protein
VCSAAELRVHWCAGTDLGAAGRRCQARPGAEASPASDTSAPATLLGCSAIFLKYNQMDKLNCGQIRTVDAA